MTAAARQLIPIDQVAAMLAQRIDALTRELLPAGRRDGHEWRCGSLAGEAGQSLGVHLAGGKAGVWCDFGSGERGDALDLVAQVLFRGDKGEALRWSLRWLGLASGDPAAIATARRDAEEAAERAQERAEADARKARNAAFAIWLGAQARIAGTPAEYYLAGRGIDLAALGRQPGALRFHPALWCEEAQRRLPALVTAIGGERETFMACHRTWLEQAAPHDWRKARVPTPKKVLGNFRGGCIRLWRGASGKPLAAAGGGEVLNVTEGIEDGLSVALALPEERVVAAVSLGNLALLELPPQIRTLRVWRQNDTNPKAIAACDRALQALLARGLQVLLPPIPDGVKDVNDLLTGGTA